MKQKEILIVVSSIFILSILWIGFHLYNVIATSTISNALSIQIIPITADFDQQAIEKLKNRKKVDPAFNLPEPASGSGQERRVAPQIQPTPTETITPTEPAPTLTEESDEFTEESDEVPVDELTP
jgi:hypothetical protein